MPAAATPFEPNPDVAIADDDVAVPEQFPNQNPFPVLRVSSRGKLLYANPNSEGLLHAWRCEVGERVPSDLSATVRECCASGQSKQLEREEAGGHWTLFVAPDAARRWVHIYALDVTDQRRAEAQLLHRALYDALTELPNRTLFMQRLRDALQSVATEEQQTAVLLINVDRFKKVNGSMGQAAGDALLAALADRLRLIHRGDDTVARFGSDEFAVLLPTLDAPGHAADIAARVSDVLGEPFVLEGREVFVRSSIGVAVSESDEDAEALVHRADVAMRALKKTGGGGWRELQRCEVRGGADELDLENDLRRAIANHELFVVYQPICDANSTRTMGFEALVRWDHPTRGLVSPVTFIPLAEETGLISDIGDLVLRAALNQVVEWDKGRRTGADFFVSVNLSAREFSDSELLDSIAAALKSSGVAACRLRLEITESVVVTDMDATLETLKALTEMGVSISIDDFGTGYSSLSYLQRLPASTLKIDRSFVRRLPECRDDLAIARAIISLAQVLELDTVAEGVETEEQLAALRELGVTYVQGYLTGRPMAAVDAARSLGNEP